MFKKALHNKKIIRSRYETRNILI